MLIFIEFVAFLKSYSSPVITGSGFQRGLGELGTQFPNDLLKILLNFFRKETRLSEPQNRVVLWKQLSFPDTLI